jgi:HD-GYP domain-containing protein (c-di-GMP phosphodiesterase class II)
MQLLKLVAKQVAVGAPLPFNVRDEHAHLLLACGQVVCSTLQLEMLLARGMYADVEEIKALAAGRKVAAIKPSVFARWNHLTWSLDVLLKQVTAEHGFPVACEDLARELMSLVDIDAEVLLYLTVRQESLPFSTYGLTHTVYSAALVQLLAQRLAWPAARVLSAVKAALTMNLSIIELQGRYAVHGRLSQEQRDDLRRHPEQAAAALRAAGVLDEEWLRAVEQHHEHVDGKGYPLGLTEVTDMAQLLRLVDVFLAKISRRESRPALDAKEAERQAYAEWPGNPMVAALIKEYGIYPPGEVVSLASGEKGVVIRRGASMQTPLVATLTDKKGLPCINSIKRDCSQREFAISAVETDKTLVARVPLERLYGLIS